MWLPKWLKRTPVITFELTADDIVVFVVGHSGSGKTWFTKAVTGSSHFKVGTNLKPRTTDVQAVRCKLSDVARRELRASRGQKSIVFVDTPSLLTGHRNQRKVEEKTTRWLKESKSKSTLVGTIYVDRVADVHLRKDSAIQEYLDCFARTFPTTQDFESLPPLRLHGVLSCDSKKGVIKEDKIVSRKDALRTQVNSVGPSLFLKHGRLKWACSSHPECLRQDEQEAWNAVVALFSNRA